ncbi:tetratricopeptide repeat protein [Ectobacillus ponti]|uniref:Tetratricopeptide repeat protein n=1 Tax=Ectobacillus ponti TaxID=2961894 RepID=A0AA42BUK4_9BACI|nr:tetratricopeptide repeat protein [Ectobacillus ponti]MCP8970618.1 tetratricopeptide repeat protein [Ectobacillus ponti]
MGKNQNMREDKGQVITFHQSGRFFYEKGMRALRRHDVDEAIRYLQRAAEIEPEPFILCELAAALAEAGSYHESNQVLQDVLRAHPKMEECYFYMADNYANLGLFYQAKKYARQYLDVTKQEEYVEDALELLDIIAEEESGDEIEGEDELILLQERANAHIRNGQLEEAVFILHSIIKQYPEFWAAYNNLAIVRFQLGDVKDALRIAEEVLERNPGNLHALCNSLIFLYSIGEIEQVNKLAAGLEHVYPMMVEQRFKLGTTLATIGRYEDAYRWLKLLKRYGYEGDFSFYYWLAYTAYKTGDQATADKVWKQVVEMYPDRAGKEPWHLAEEHHEDAHLLLKHLEDAFEGEQSLEGKLMGLYFINKVDLPERIGLLFAYIQQEEPVLSQMARYLFLEASGKQVPKELQEFRNCVEAAEALYNRNEPDQFVEDCLWLLFKVFADSYQHQSFKNAAGWAAAVEYITRSTQKRNMTQAEIGHIYNISISTLRKYVQTVKQLGR